MSWPVARPLISLTSPTKVGALSFAYSANRGNHGRISARVYVLAAPAFCRPRRTPPLQIARGCGTLSRHSASRTRPSKGRPPRYLLMRASHTVVPIDERALRVVPPCPDVKLEERRNGETVGIAHEQKHLTVQNGRAGIVLQPSRLVHDVLHADQFHFTVRLRLVDQSLRFCDVNGPVQQTLVHVVDSHRTVVGTADATEQRPVSRRSGVIDVEELLRGRLDGLNERGRTGRRVVSHCMLR